MRITVTTTAQKLSTLLGAGEVFKADGVKKTEERFTVLLQNTSDADIYMDSTATLTVANGCVLAAGTQISMEVTSLSNISLISAANKEILVMIV